MAVVPHNFLDVYQSLPRRSRTLVLRELRRWGCWTKTTVYRKLAGESVTPIEQVLIDGVLGYYTREQDTQQRIQFVYNHADGLKMKP